MHFAYFLALFLVRKPVEKTIECFVSDKVELEKYNQNNDNLWTKEVDGDDMLYFDLRKFLPEIQWLHFISFILLILAKWADRTSLHSHIAVYL
jgi:hypothetical protein